MYVMYFVVFIYTIIQLLAKHTVVQLPHHVSDSLPAPVNTRQLPLFIVGIKIINISGSFDAKRKFISINEVICFN